MSLASQSKCLKSCLSTFDHKIQGICIQSLYFIPVNHLCHCSNPHKQFLRVPPQLLSKLCISCAQLFHYTKRTNATLFHISSTITYLLKTSQQFLCLHLLNGPHPTLMGKKSFYSGSFLCPFFCPETVSLGQLAISYIQPAPLS